MVEAPADTPDDLVERYRQLRPFELAEMKLISALVLRPGRLPPEREQVLRQALAFARLWLVPTERGELAVGAKLGPLRETVGVLAETIDNSRDLDPADLARDAAALRPVISRAKERLLAGFGGELLASQVDREIGERKLVLVLGGGGGCGYVHLGAFSVLRELGVDPALIAGSSMGSILGLFRSRERVYRDATVRAVTHGLTFKKLFRVLEGQTKYGLPGTLRLYLRSAMSRFFVGPAGDTMRLDELDIPFICMVTGLRRDAIGTQMQTYQARFGETLRRGAFRALRHIQGLVTSWTRLMSELIRSGGMKPIALGLDERTAGFDVLDAAGFSCAVPALIHYDILRDDPRMHTIMQATLRHHQVDHFVDGGIASNVPARAAWEAVQRGRIGTRNTFIMALDCFAPQLRRNMLFLPLMRLAAENVTRDRAFAHHMFRYRRVLAPAALVPSRRSMEQAIRHGKEEFGAESAFISKVLEPLPPIPPE